MKKHLLTGIGALFVVGACLTSCSDDPSPYGGVTGKLVPTVNLDSRVTVSDKAATPKAPASRAEGSAMDVSVDELTLTLTPKEGEVFTHKGVSTFPVDKEFKVGEYLIEASYGDPEQEGFDLPAYYGAESIIIEENRTTSITLKAQLINSMVSVEFGDDLVKYATDLSAHVQTTGDKIAFASTETRAAYVKPGATTVTVTLTKPNGVSGTVAIPTFTAKARTHHHVKLDLVGGSGDAAITVTFDSTVTNEDVEIELSDDILNSPAPTAVAKGFTSGQTLDIIEGLSTPGNLTVDITAHASLESVVMTTVSPALTDKGWPATIDLCKASPAEQAAIKALGFDAIGVFRNPGRMAVLDFTGVAEHIPYVAGGNNSAEFTISVLDKASKAAEPVQLLLNVAQLELQFSAVTTEYPENPGEPIEFNLEYNGYDPASELAFEYKNDRGVWEPMKVISIEAASRAVNTYKVTVEAPDIEFSLEARAHNSKVNAVSESVVVAQSEFRLKVSENDIFATHGAITVTSKKYDAAALAANGTLSLTPSVPGLEKTVNGSVISLSGLAPATTYTATLLYDGQESRGVKFTTETAAQLANSGMEDWTSTDHKSYHTEYFVGGDIWGTLNPLTISQSADGSNVAYVASSGTLPDDNGVSGKCALIRTIAWGSGTTAAGGWSLIKHVDRGELFLGSWDGVEINDGNLPNYGISFSSRPSSLSFKYKFSKYNNRTGYVEIEVLDAAGKTLAKASRTIDEMSSWSDMNLPLTYAAGAGKAAKLKLVFRSTNVGKPIDGAALGKDDVNKGSVSASVIHTGSQLYVDDITLNY